MPFGLGFPEFTPFFTRHYCLVLPATVPLILVQLCYHSCERASHFCWLLHIPMQFGPCLHPYGMRPLWSLHLPLRAWLGITRSGRLPNLGRSCYSVT